MDSDLDLSDEEPDFAIGDLSEDEADDFQETVRDTAGFDEEEVAFSDEGLLNNICYFFML